MNKHTAQLEAQKRWGNWAHAWIVAGVRYVSQDITSNFGSGWNHFDGCGNSWEEAFADAEKRSEPEPEPAGSRDRDEWKHEAAAIQTDLRQLKRFPRKHEAAQQMRLK